MAATSVGEIGLDLVVNQNDFKKQMAGINSLAKKAGAALASAFAVKKLVGFGTACIELGSDLQEVQNVVDVTFPTMRAQIEDFADSAAASFGLSETMAKKYSSLFGTMSRQFGFTEKAAYDMGTTLAGLAGDVASFYNITQDEAYTKLKSVFSGETETLKDIGIVMTQSALDAYALANGFGKTTKSMSEAEKVALRYQFVQEQLAAASGDFLRTADGWANQVKVLKLQFDSLKATIGQGLINILTPVIKVINTLVGKLMSLADAFKSFTEMFTGKEATGDAASQMQATAAAADSGAMSTEAVGDAAVSSAKKMKSLFAFDEMNVLPDNSSTSGSDEAFNMDAFSMAAVDTTVIDEVDSKYQALIDKAQELVSLFKQGFQFGFGDTDVIGNIRQSLDAVKESFLDIFGSTEVKEAADNFLKTFVESIGINTGALASIGASIADNLLGGTSRYLENSSERIREYVVSMFDIGSRFSDIGSKLSGVIATIAESLRSDGAVRISESLTGGVSDAFMGITELCSSLTADLLEVITGPFVDNQDAIRATLEELFTAVAPIFEGLKALVDEWVGSLQSAYDDHIGPMFTAFRDGFSEIIGTLLEAYNTHILPVIEGISEKFSVFKEQYLSPLIEKFGEFTGKVADAVGAVWTNALKPAIEEFINTWAPVVSAAIEGIGQFFFDIGAIICGIVDGLLTAFGGLLDFITGVFSGDWDQAWQGIQDFFSGVWDVMYGTINEQIQLIWDTIMSVLDIIGTYFKEKFDGVKQTVSTALNSVKNTVTNIFSDVWKFIKGTINNILGGIESMANGVVKGVNKVIGALNGLSFKVPEWVPLLGGKEFGFNITELKEISIPKLAGGGYVKANTPQLAMIGDNRHQGEVVAPEDKLYEVSARAMKDVMQQFMSVLASMANGFAQGRDATLVLKVTGEMAPLVRLLKVEMEKEASRTGIDFKVVYE